jgi:tetratricopeptide (TPR) repeat protein
VARLSEPERAYIEGYSYGRNLETRGRAIAVYRRALARYPHLDAVRLNLANLLIAQELYDEAIELLDGPDLRRREKGIQALALAEANVARGDFDDGFLFVDEHLRHFPDSFIIHQFLARLLTFAGRLDEAEAALARAEELRPEDPRTAFHRWHLPVLRGEWDEAEEITERLGREKLPWRQRSLVFRGFFALFRGHSSAAARLFEQAAEAYPEAGQLRALADAQAARHLLDLGRHESALDHARAAQQAESNHWEAFVGLASEALAQQALGREAEADLAAAELVRMAEGLPGDVGRRMAHELRGRLAAARGDVDQAIVELEQAEALLPASGDTSIRSRIFGPDHPRIWFALASAYLRAGKTERAAERFRRVTESPLRTRSPLEAVRSLYFLGQIHEQRGEEALARGYYRRFVDHWRDGDLDRDQVEHALRFLTAPGWA